MLVKRIKELAMYFNESIKRCCKVLRFVINRTCRCCLATQLRCVRGGVETNQKRFISLHYEFRLTIGFINWRRVVVVWCYQPGRRPGV